MSSFPEVNAVCLCGFFDFPALRGKLAESFTIINYRDVAQISVDQGDVFVFHYGVVVFWNIVTNRRNDITNILDKYANEPLVEKLIDQFTYQTNTHQTALKDDHISLPDDDIMTRLALSHGIAQSTKLEQYEANVLRTIASTEHIPESIAQTGKSGLRRNELAKLRGHLFLTKSDVMLHFDLLDVPEFFWEYPELQPFYSLIADYLEIKPRIEVLNKKLETIQDLLAMIVDEQHHAHSSMLEWIIICLIAIDIIIILAQEIFLK